MTQEEKRPWCIACEQEKGAALPYPPSANRYWRVWRGRMLVSSAARL